MGFELELETHERISPISGLEISHFHLKADPNLALPFSSMLLCPPSLV